MRMEGSGFALVLAEAPEKEAPTIPPEVQSLLDSFPLITKDS